jgi:hypothetical protein
MISAEKGQLGTPDIEHDAIRRGVFIVQLDTMSCQGLLVVASFSRTSLESNVWAKFFHESPRL